MSKIAYLIPEFPGQTQSFFIREKQALKALGIEVELLSTRRPIDGAGAAKHAWADAAAKQTTYLFPMPASQILLSTLSFILAGPAAWLRCLKIIAGKSDMHAVERIKMFGLILSGAYLKRLCRKRAIHHIHVHSCANAANSAMFAKLLNGPEYSMTLHGHLQIYGTNQANKWRHASFAIVVTKMLVNEVKEQLPTINLPPIFAAPMGVDIDNFKRSKPYQSPRKGELIRLVATGRINPAKAHHDLVRAVALLRDRDIKSELRILGSTDSQSVVSGYESELQALVTELKLEDQIKFLGSVSEDQVKQELEDAHLFCLASLMEGLSVAVMEAMAMGAPTIVTRLPAIHELVEESVDGIFVDTRAPEQFANTIESLLDEPEKLAALSRAGEEKIRQHFHSGVSAQAIAEGLQHNPKLKKAEDSNKTLNI